ncbi:MAG: leucyl aminopeptidase, partial [Pseudomonadota bacterium]
MTSLTPFTFAATDTAAFATQTGRVAVIVTPEGKLEQSARRVNRLSKGAVQRFVDSDRFAKVKPGQVTALSWPAGMTAEAVDVICLARNHSVADARKAGAALAKLRGSGPVLLALDSARRAPEIIFGFAMRDYRFDTHKTAEDEAREGVTVMCSKPDDMESAAAPLLAVADGAHFTRDLTNEPANVLTTTDFANRLDALKSIGLTVEVLEEKELEKLGMRSLLSVGQGSDSPSKVVVMQWNGGDKDAAPLALIGKGVVFDTGGISLKPAGGMEDMTMDMGGAGVVSGVMKALALRKAKANVVGLVGLVENMPSGTATRPGDVVATMKGDTVEVINTDAEGRLVLCDVM